MPNPSFNLKRAAAKPGANLALALADAGQDGFMTTYLHQARSAFEWLHPSEAHDGVPSIRRFGWQRKPVRFGSF